MFESGRYFQLWHAGVGHRTLLLRATKTKEDPTRIDLMFKPVFGMELVAELHGIRVSEARAEYHQTVLAELTDDDSRAATAKTFTIESGAFRGYVVAGVFLASESDRAYNEPSELLSPVRAKLKGLDANGALGSELRNFKPEDPEHFSIAVTASIGPADDNGAELFELTVCSSGFVGREPLPEGFEFRRGTLLLDRWDLGLAERAISDLCRRTEGYFWRDVAIKLTRYLLWEFEDHDDS